MINKLSWRNVLDGTGDNSNPEDIKEKNYTHVHELMTDASSVGYKYAVYRDGRVYTYHFDKTGLMVDPTDFRFDDIE